MLRYQPSIRYQGKTMSGTTIYTDRAATIYADRSGKRKKRRIRECDANKAENKKKTSKERTKINEVADEKVIDSVNEVEDSTDEVIDASQVDATVKEDVTASIDTSASTVGVYTKLCSSILQTSHFEKCRTDS